MKRAKRQSRQRGRSPASASAGNTTPPAARKSRSAQLEAIAGLGHLALTSGDLQQLMNAAVRRLAITFDTDFASVLELDEDRREWVLRAAIGWPAALVGRTRIEHGPASQAGFTLLAAEPVILEDLRSEKRFRGSALLRDHGVVSGITTIIDGHPQPYGVLGVHSRRRRDFSNDDVHFVRTVASVLAAAVKYRHAAAALQASEARMRAIVTTAVDAIIAIDHQGIIDSANLAAEKLFGYAANEMIGQNVSMLMPEPYHSEHDGYVGNYLKTGRAKIIGIGREVVGRRKDGTVFPMDLAVSEFRLGDRRMFTGIVHDITKRRALERDILDAAAEEQRRIGQDLHDGLCQHLAGIAFATQVLTQKLEARSAPETQGAARVGEMIDDAITQARDLARGLQPVTLVAFGLAVALEELAARAKEMFHIACVFICGGSRLVNDVSVAAHLYRIAQEALSNAVKHGKARTVSIDLETSPDQVSLMVNDDGVGLENAPADGKGMGLRTMAYRTHLLDGTLTVQPGERGGTIVTCVVRKPGIGEESNTEANDGHEGATRKTKKQDTRRRRPPDRARAPR